MTDLDLSDARVVGGAVALDVFGRRRLCRAVTLELGVNSGKRLDVVGLNHWGEILGAEVKVARSDWLANAGNIAQCIQHCDWFYLATPEGLLKPGEFDEWRQGDFGNWRKSVGHIEVSSDGQCRIVSRARRLRPSMAARFEIILRMAARGNDPGFCPRCGYRASRIETQETA